MASYRLRRVLLLGALASLPMASQASTSYSVDEMMRVQQALMAGRPNDCPPCFNCLLPVNSCAQYAICNESNGICDCPEGFGGDNCLEPLCGSLPRGRDRPMRQGNSCDCDEGWTGVNCNVCTSNDVCKPFVGNEEVGVCYDGGVAIEQNFQMCDVTNEKITSLLGDQKPQVTISCRKEDKTCNFQFWVDNRESFYCHLDECESDMTYGDSKNSTAYNCKGIKCDCIADRMLCGENGSVDISEFLSEEIKGPGKIECTLEAGKERRCAFREPAMDSLITDLIGDSSILLTCRSGECVHYTQVPGYHPPVSRINTPLIAGIIAGFSLLLVALILVLWYISRRAYRYGPIYLEDSDDEQTRLMVDHKPSSLYFQDVSYHLNEKRILGGISGVAHPGEVTAVMGASGAGKTTFLDILARKNKRGVVSGEFYVNGVKVADNEFRSAVGFVDQEDTMLPTLTVHETILNSAMLRLPRDMSWTAKERRVYEVEKELGIYHIRDSLIGSSEGKGRGISGGEKRRVGIACELVTSPSILFLDEPTSGLDAFNAYNVIEALVTLAKNYKRTVIFTIHQPRSNIVALFDRLVLLAQGKMVYSGPFTQCQSFFSQVGYSCPTGFNIADYLVDLTMHASLTSILDDGSIAADAASLGVSSTRAIKSIASISGVSVSEESNTEASSSRPRAGRNGSIRQRQERELFSKRKSTADTTESSDAGVEDSGNYKLQRNPASSSAPLLNASHDLPPTDGADTELDALVQSFSQSAIASNAREETQQAITETLDANGQNANGVDDGTTGMGKGYARVGYVRQFVILSRRTWKNLYRNPMLMLAHYAIAITLAVLLGYLFYGLSNELAGFQNRLGLFFFLLALFGFSTLSILNVFSTERLLFVRERANGYYSPFTYFAAKVLFDIIPLRIIPPILMGLIIYPMTGLIPDYVHFFRFLLVVVLFNLVAATICLFIGIVFKDPGLANLLGSLVMLASLLFSGPLLNAEAIPKAAVWLKSLSIFHYGFESLIVNEVVQLTLIDRKYGLDITVPGAAILSSFGFNNDAFWEDVAWLGLFAAFFMVLSYASLHFLLVEKR